MIQNLCSVQSANSTSGAIVLITPKFPVGAIVRKLSLKMFSRENSSPLTGATLSLEAFRDVPPATAIGTGEPIFSGIQYVPEVVSISDASTPSYNCGGQLDIPMHFEITQEYRNLALAVVVSVTDRAYIVVTFEATPPPKE